MSDSRDDFIISIRYALIKKGAKQKFSLFFLIIFSILIIILDKYSVPPINFFRTTLNDFVYRVSVLVSLPERAIYYLGSGLKKHITIYKEVKTLKEEVERLKKNEFDKLFLITENKNLKTELGLNSPTNYEGELIAARVMFDQESPFLKSLLVNKGTKHGINKGMTVFSKKYLIGVIIETNYLSSRVLLITDLNSRIPTIIQDTDVNTILAGNGDKNNLLLKYLPTDFVLEADKIIYTSGKDGLLSAGMPVAQSFLNKDNELKIKTLADPQQASIVYLSKGHAPN